MVKADLYLGAGVLEVWLIDSGQRRIEIRTLSGLRVVDEGEVAESESVLGFAIDLTELFGA